MNLAENLERTARARGRSAAMTVGDRVTTFAALDLDSRAVAGLLAGRGVRPGDRVGMLVPNVPEFAAIYYAILRLGAVVVPLDPLLDEHEVAHHLEDSGSRALVAGDTTGPAVGAAARSVGADILVLGPGGLRDLVTDAASLDRIEPRAAGDTAAIVYTSGSTGRPRGAELTHGNLVRNCEVVVNDVLQLTSEDVVFGGLPLFHSFGQSVGLNAAVRAGACLALLPRFAGEAALRTLQDQLVTVMQGLPAMYAAMLEQPHRSDYDLSRLRVGVSGGAAMPVGVLLGFEDAFDCLVLEGYGLSETSPVVSFNRRDRRRVGSIGMPVKGVELRVADERGAGVEDGEPGELQVRGHNVMKGYWGRPDDTAAAFLDGWLRTGDVGMRDEDGFFYVVDRTTELINRGGQWVYPREVEEVLHEHPDVVEAAVIGLPHPTLGEEIGAVVTLRPFAGTTGNDLRDFVKARVAAYKYPRTVDIVDAMPKTATGKILKRAIRLETRA
ncbi:MAG: long-chain fatty acid--CoA ligase [Nocardioides sp.]